MTRLDFAKGWLFLTAQPWGKAYRTTDRTSVGGEPSPADLQSEFYYKVFGGLDAVLWLQACQSQAMGEHWPSVSTLRQCIHDLTPASPSSTTTQGQAYITEDEFVLPLFETIKTISGLTTLRQQLNEAVYRNRSTTDLATRYREAQEYLANQLPTLTDCEMADVLARYPHVATL